MPDFNDLDAKSIQGNKFGAQGPKRLGNQSLSTDMLALTPIETFSGLKAQGESITVSRHRRKVESCRIGEAANPGPGLDNKQHKQLNMVYFVVEIIYRKTSKLSGVKLWGSELNTSKEMEIVFTPV
eukprot:8805760-Heterocapsa_arctica.AAC.1